MRRGKLLRLLLIIVIAMLAFVVLFYLFDPDARLKGLLRGDPSYRGRPATAWRTDLGSGDENTHAIAFERLKEGKGEAVPVLEAVLRSGEPAAARWRAADALGQIGPDARPAGPALVAALKDPDPEVRKMAARALGKLAPDVPGAVPALAELFPDIDAMRAVSQFKQAGADAVPKLIGLLDHPDARVRWEAARTLGKIGEPAKSAAPGLVKQLSDPDPLVREHAAEALGDIGPAVAQTVPELEKATADPEWKVRRDAVRSLGQMGQAAKDALPRVRELKKDADPNVRQAAERAERMIADASAAPGQRRPQPSDD